MSKLLWKSLLAAPAALGAALAVSGSAVAVEAAAIEFATETAPVELATEVAPVELATEAAPVQLAAAAAPVESVVGVDALNQPVQLAQITSVNQLTDVLPTDWAFQALQSLVEQYGCIQGYPDRTYRGNASLTRYEFAAGLNACLDVIAQLVATGINPDDLATIRRLQEEFQAELNTLRGRVDALEADVAELEANQFSTTTKLRGQVDFHLATPFDTIPGVEDSTNFNSRARLNFDTSFTGEDRLRVRLQASSGDLPLADIGGFNNVSGLGGEGVLDLRVDDFYYAFPVGNRIDVTLAANSLSVDDVLREITPFGNGVADAAGPQYLDAGMGGGAGVGLSFAFTDSLILDALYTVNTAGARSPSIGVFRGTNELGPSQAYGAQLSFIPEGFLSLAATYLHSDGGQVFQGVGTGKAVDTYGGQINLNFGGFNVGGSAGFVNFDGGDDFVWNAGVVFDDFFAEGAQLGIYGGQAPQLIGSVDNPFYIEGFLNVPFNEFLTITPSVIYADYNNGLADETLIYGVIRTTFRF
ncbi:MAG: carbohydrate porin [Cyanobacteria bacterium Co-bin8]|nr:carbohydrate porin [Cyanobacteria bacterium Co-bin8]